MQQEFCKSEPTSFLVAFAAMAADVQKVDAERRWMIAERNRRDWSTTKLADIARAIAHREGSTIKLAQQSISDFEQPGKAKRLPEWLRYVRMAFAEGEAGEPDVPDDLLSDASLSERLAARMTELDVSQAELARRVKISQPSINAIYRGETQNPKHLRAIAQALDTTEAWLRGETEDPIEGALTAFDREGMADRLGLYLVPEVDTGWAMGEGTFLDVIEETGTRAFATEWLRSISSGNLAKLFVSYGDGDSMEPTLHDGDVVLIDQAQKAIEKQDRIWAVTVGGLGVIKRVAKLPNGDYELGSDNHRVRPRVVTAEEFNVVGRVIWIGRRI